MIRLSVTLALVGICSAALLSVINNITEPIIIERQAEEYRLALESFFPDFDEFETREEEEGQFDLIFDSSGEQIGVMATVAASGYEGDILHNLAFNSAGEIIGVRIVAHSETPGIGDVIETDSFIDQFIGKSYADSITAGDDVDAITGATVSTVAMINSIRRTTDFVGEQFLGVETATVDITAVPDGTYTGSCRGFMGDIVVEVEVSGGKIMTIIVTEQEETPSYFIESYPLIPELIIAEQSFDVDTATGATASAEAIVCAVIDALAGAANGNGGEND